ncbi:hypothetical protein [Amycolatopsis anabasis]|uniref:hypothetical protein n=1 Tax=Amycolatopsis anabasis TaxID=1840409 RepID=UPI00131E12F4|nr:hypothetical protein [Amycolatopsis anabasis]
MNAMTMLWKPRAVPCSQTAGEQVRAVAQLSVLLVFVLVMLQRGYDPQTCVATATAVAVLAAWSGTVKPATVGRRLPVLGEWGGAR